MAIFKVDIPGLIGEVDKEDLQFLGSAKGTIIEHLSDPLFGSSSLAKALHLSPNQLTKRFQKLTHYSPSRMIKYFRMEYAMVLIRQSQIPLKEVAFKTGFLEQANFTRTFKKHFGRNPSAVRDSLKAKKPGFQFECSSPLKPKDLQYIYWLSSNSAEFGNLLKAIIINVQDEHFGPEQLAETLSISPSQLNRQTQHFLKISPYRFIKNIRLQYALELLMQEEKPVGTIAHHAGFYDHPHFCRVFKEAYDHSPKTFRAIQKGKATPRFVLNLIPQYKIDN